MDTDRLKAIMIERDVSQSELARRVGVTQGAIQQIVSGRTQQSKIEPDIAGQLGVSLAWLRGKSDDRFAGNSSPPDDISYDLANTVQIPEIDIGYAMGGGTYLDAEPEVVAYRTIDRSLITGITRSSTEMLFMAKGIGDSMVPTLLDNDAIIVDRSHRSINQQDRVWAVAYGELGMIKRIRRLPNGSFKIISDNPAVADFDAAADELHVIGRVIFVGRTM